ncbi:MAG TPA: ACT domain-containing protein [Spirochaetota bacterium]|nr:ACT domain-containing protein [Spirochaetota bacterium]
MIKQISVFLENKKGRLSEVTKTIADNGIDIKALTLADTKDFGVLRLIVTDPDKCVKILKESNFVAQETEVIAIEIEDAPGGLSKILELLNSNDVNIEYIYATIEKVKNKAIVIFRIEEKDKAREVLSKNGINIYEMRDIINNM